MPETTPDVILPEPPEPLVVVPVTEKDLVGVLGNRGSVSRSMGSWSERIKFITSMTVEEAQEYFEGLFENLPKATGKTIKDIMIMRSIAQFMIEPTPGLWNTIMEREEGKIADRVDVNQVTEVQIRLRKAGSDE